MAYRVAIIDDNYIFCFIFEKLIKKYEKHSIDVLSFSNGKEALDYLLLNMNTKDLLPNLIFVDINMPILNGWEFLDALTKVNTNVFNEIIFFIVSSSDNKIDINKAKEYDFVKNYLHKPLDKLKLFSILDEYLP